MSTITISDEHWKRLETLAKEANMAPEELARATLENWLDHPQPDFKAVAEYILKKNKDLYQRLA